MVKHLEGEVEAQAGRYREGQWVRCEAATEKNTNTNTNTEYKIQIQSGSAVKLQQRGKLRFPKEMFLQEQMSLSVGLL